MGNCRGRKTRSEGLGQADGLIHQYTNGEYGHIVHFAFDEDRTKARLKAEAKYHDVLAAAAMSELPQHSASLMEGRLLMSQCYTHETQKQETEPATTE